MESRKKSKTATLMSVERAETRARLAWSRKRPSLIASLSKKESFEQTRELLISAYENMLRARLCDEKAVILYKQAKVHFQIGVAGHEAIQVATALAFDTSTDAFYPYYRDMAFCAALGMTNEEFMLNCLNKAADPNSGGRQMPMHYGARRLNIVSQSSATGTQFLQAVGYALALKKKGSPGVVYVSAGEGACSEGDFHEAMNWSSRDKLPIVFLIQNNAYAISVPLSEQFGAKNVFELSQGFTNLLRVEVDGTDFFESYDAAQKAVEWARGGNGAALIEAHVVRLQSHSISDDQLKYRDADEIAEDQKECPLGKLRQYLLINRICTDEYLAAIQDRITAEIMHAAEWADAQPGPRPEDACANTLNLAELAAQKEEKPAVGEPLLYIDAINRALDEEMDLNEDIYVFGEDVARDKGGVFGATNTLSEKYGEDRCFNTPIAESAIVGIAAGMAAAGLKPAAEIQFGDYIWYGMMQLRNEVAMMRYRSAGEWCCPMVIRIPTGGYVHGGCYHSQSIEATLAHIPGLLVIYPSNATDAHGLLKNALRSNNSILFLEHKALYRQPQAKGRCGGKDYVVPIGKAKTVRRGEHATIITWGALVHKCVEAAKAAKEKGYSVEIIDLRTLVPFDREAVFESVKRTSRVLIAHEDIEFMGFGAEIAAQVASECFSFLDAPVMRVGMKYAGAVPHAPALEKVVLPQERDITEALNRLLGY